MSQKKYVSYEEYGNLLSSLVQTIKSSETIKPKHIYGIPRGGLPIAVHLSHHLNLPLIRNWWEENNILIVDDIIDTGKTLTSYKAVFDDNVKYWICSLYYKPISIVKPDLHMVETLDWIVFPWESREEKPNKYHQKIYKNIFGEKEL